MLDAAAEVARDRGPDALTLREVARRAGVSHTAAYNHFADKNDLLRGLAVRAFDELHADLAAVAGQGLDSLAVVYLRFAWRHRTEFRFMFSRALCMPEGVPDPLEVASRDAESVLRQEVVAEQERGVVAAGDPDQVLLAVWAQVHGLTTIVLETPAFKSLPLDAAEALARQQIRVLLDGLG